MLCWFAQRAIASPHTVVSTLAQSHPYRHGVVPMRGHLAASLQQSDGSGNLAYHGGLEGAGVMTSAPRVYLVFWGSQWGATATNAQGDTTLAGDPVGMAPDLQQFMNGLGTNGETWSGVMTQYCQGIAVGGQTCPAGAAHVAHAAGGALAGVWADESSAAPPQATGHQIGLEAVRAATHFGNTSQPANRNVQYVIVSPTGTHPDGFDTTSAQFCAWHDWTGDGTLSGGAVSSPYGQLPFTNLPYVTDAGTRCGQHFVNSGASGALDAVTIVEGHEYAESLTDPYPATGWVDSSGNEDADKCAWVGSGQGASQNIALNSGSFAVQSTWANDANGGQGGCEISHPIAGT
jgi:hypothetical protein